ELVSILQLVLYKLSVCESGATYGEKLQNLKYRNERSCQEISTLSSATGFGDIRLHTCLLTLSPLILQESHPPATLRLQLFKRPYLASLLSEASTYGRARID